MGITSGYVPIWGGLARRGLSARDQGVLRSSMGDQQVERPTIAFMRETHDARDAMHGP